MDYPRTAADSAAFQNLLGWLKSEAEARGSIEDIACDHDRLWADIGLAPHHEAVVFAWYEQTDRGLAVNAGLLRFDPLDKSKGGDLGRHLIRRRPVPDRLAAVALMKVCLERLFVELDASR
jgi:hypothetical protein